MDSFVYAIPISILVFFMVFMMFQWEYQLSYFSVLLYLGLPLMVYGLASLSTMMAHYSECSRMDAGQSFLHSLPSMGMTWIALGVSYFSWARIPIASAISPLFLGNTVDIVRTSNSSHGCPPPTTLETIENNVPMVKGFSYGFYLFFSTLFSMLLSIGFSSGC